MRWASPWFLVLIVLLPVLIRYCVRYPRRPGLLFSQTTGLTRIRKSRRQRWIGAPMVLRVLALLAIAIALAWPQAGGERVRQPSRGIAIEMVVDRSSSMGAQIEYLGQRVTRLDAVKTVFEEFVKGRPSDLIGLVAFARYADTICPLTLAHHSLSNLLPAIRLADSEDEDGTAIGDAVVLAAARLHNAGGQDYAIKSRIVILLTDGDSNGGSRSLQDAAKSAAELGIRVYAIAVRGEVRDEAERAGRMVAEAQLASLSETTGGRFHGIRDANALPSIYAEIDRLERSDWDTVRWINQRESFPIFAVLALCFLASEVTLSGTWLRRIP